MQGTSLSFAQASAGTLRQCEGVLAQALNYLEAYGLTVGLLINSGSKSLQFKRAMKKSKPAELAANPSWRSTNHTHHSPDSIIVNQPITPITVQTILQDTSELTKIWGVR